MTIFEYLAKHAKENPDKISLISPKYKLTYEELYKTIAYNQSHLNFDSNKSVILKMVNQTDYTLNLLVLLSMGLWVVPIPPASSESELAKIKSVVGDSIIIDDENNPITINYDTTETLKQIDGDKAGIYHMTSGSTGEPKFCVRSINNLTVEGESYRETLNLSASDKILNLPPLYHSYALGAACIAGIVSGSAIYAMDKFIPRKAMDLIHNEKPTIMILVPFMVKMMATTYISQQKDFSSLRIALAGSGKINKETYQLFVERFKLPLMCNYGSTETGGLITRLLPEPFDAIGKPMAGVECKLVDEEGKLVKQGAEGEVWIKTAAMLKEYLNNNSLYLDDDGFYNMNDIGVQDEEGNYYIKRRKKSIINIAGKKVNPLEVEEVLLEYPGVKDCIVLGFTRDNGNEAVKAVVAVSKEVTEGDLRKYCHLKLSQIKVPSKFELCSSIPRNELGKVKYDLVKEKNHE